MTETANSYRPVNVLFCSAGRRVELLRAFRRAYDQLGLAGNIVALDVDPLAPALQAACRPHIVPRLTEPEYIPALVEICWREAVDLVFPLIDPDIPLLAEHRETVEAGGARVAVVSQEAAAVTADKWQTAQFFQKIGLPTPRSWLPEQLDPGQMSYPLFIKPRQGSAARHTFRINDERQLAFFMEYVPDPIVQEYLPGPEITSDVICDLDGEVLGVVSRQRIEVRWGEVAKGVTISNQEITEACLRVARALPAVGPITVQCLMKDSRPYFTEINARMGGGLPLGIAAGADAPRWLLARAAGLDLPIPPLGSYETDLFLTRCDESFFIDQDERDRLAEGRVEARELAGGASSTLDAITRGRL